MIRLIMEEENFLRELEKLNEYYLMVRGDFYQLLLEESRGMDKIAHQEKARVKLNEQYLQNTFMRLNTFEDAKRVSFDLKPLGFNFHGFKNFSQLCPVGNINLIDGKALRFNGSECALWHKTKQLLENDFHISFVFQFKKYPKFFKIEPKDLNHSATRAILSLVIQNAQEVLQNSHSNPSNLRLL